MRIRRRQAILSSAQQHSDPSTAPPNATRNQQHWLLLLPEGAEELQEERLHPDGDLGGDADEYGSAAALPLLQQTGTGTGNVVGRRSESPGAGGGGAQPRRQGADGIHSHMSGGIENGRRGRPEPVSTDAAGERPVNGGIAAAAAASTLNVKEESKNGSGGAKKRRGSAVLMEGSRCSRVNGRGWRCSQPTLVGYSLCEHHLGKGRMRSGGASTVAAAAQLGHTESAGRKNAAAVPRTDERHC